MQSLRSRAVSGVAAFASILILTNSAYGSPIVSVTTAPRVSTAIGPEAVATSWSQTNGYIEVTIQALVDALTVGETPMGTAYLTTRIGPGTTSLDEIAAAPFTVPLQLPVCSPSSCGGEVTLFSGLSLGPGTYFLTLGPPTGGVNVPGWFPAASLSPTIVTDDGVVVGSCFSARAPNITAYPPASAFLGAGFSCGVGTIDFEHGGIITASVMNFTVTGTRASSIPEPASTALISCGVCLLIRRSNRLSKRKAAGTAH